VIGLKQTFSENGKKIAEKKLSKLVSFLKHSNLFLGNTTFFGKPRIFFSTLKLFIAENLELRSNGAGSLRSKIAEGNPKIDAI